MDGMSAAVLPSTTLLLWSGPVGRNVERIVSGSCREARQRSRPVARDNSNCFVAEAERRTPKPIAESTEPQAIPGFRRFAELGLKKFDSLALPLLLIRRRARDDKAGRVEGRGHSASTSKTALLNTTTRVRWQRGEAANHPGGCFFPIPARCVGVHARIFNISHRHSFRRASLYCCRACLQSWSRSRDWTEDKCEDWVKATGFRVRQGMAANYPMCSHANLPTLRDRV
jgi:hypothetical protein